MNLYFLVEGRRTEKRLYRAWIAHMFPTIAEAERIEDMHGNHFFLLAGNGYPAYKGRIHNALTDIELHGAIDHFFVCVDAEEEPPERKRSEVEALLAPVQKAVHYTVVIHNCCIETWFLGHSRIMKRHPESGQLRDWKAFYDVSQDDPEGMGFPAPYQLHAPFHLDYLQEMLREQGLTYSKNHPGVVADKSYLLALITRQRDTGHLQSFTHLLRAWRLLGGTI